MKTKTKRRPRPMPYSSTVPPVTDAGDRRDEDAAEMEAIIDIVLHGRPEEALPRFEQYRRRHREPVNVRDVLALVVERLAYGCDPDGTPDAEAVADAERLWALLDDVEPTQTPTVEEEEEEPTALAVVEPQRLARVEPQVVALPEVFTQPVAPPTLPPIVINLQVSLPPLPATHIQLVQAPPTPVNVMLPAPEPVVVNVAAPVIEVPQQPAPVVNVSVKESKRSVEFERDQYGQIKGAKVVD